MHMKILFCLRSIETNQTPNRPRPGFRSTLPWIFRRGLWAALGAAAPLLTSAQNGPPQHFKETDLGNAETTAAFGVISGCNH